MKVTPGLSWAHGFRLRPGPKPNENRRDFFPETGDPNDRERLETIAEHLEKRLIVIVIVTVIVIVIVIVIETVIVVVIVILIVIVTIIVIVVIIVIIIIKNENDNSNGSKWRNEGQEQATECLPLNPLHESGVHKGGV